MQQIIGVTGTLSSGKDELAKYLQSLGWEHISLSDIIRLEARKLNMELTRDNLISLGNQLRKTEGNACLAKRALLIMKLDKNYVVTSFRHPDEVLAMKKPGFRMIKLDAPIEIRFNRARARNRENEALTFEEFRKKEENELFGKESFSQQINATMKLAQITLLNDSTTAEFHKKIDELLESLEKIKK